GLARVADLDAEAVAVSEQRLDLFRQVARDDGDTLATRRLEVAEDARDDGPAVDRQDRLRPALGQRPQAAAFAGRHHDRLPHPVRPSERSETSPSARSVRESARRRSRRTPRSWRPASRQASWARDSGPKR